MFEGDGAQASSFSNLKFSEIFDIIIIENEKGGGATMKNEQIVKYPGSLHN